MSDRTIPQLLQLLGAKGLAKTFSEPVRDPDGKPTGHVAMLWWDEEKEVAHGYGRSEPEAVAAIEVELRRRVSIVEEAAAKARGPQIVLAR
jgi:hypothetical protein